MRLFFFEFGTFDGGLFSRVVRELTSEPAEVALQLGTQAGEYSPVREGLTEGMNILLRRETLCLSVKPHDSEIRWMLLFPPNAMETAVPMWHAIFEVRSASHEPLFNRVKDMHPEYIAVARDEPFNVTEASLHPESFPWASPHFVAAALRDEAGRYVEQSPKR